MALYGRLRKLGGAGATRRMIDLLRQKLSASSRWDSPADLLVGIMIGEEMFDAAWDLVREHGASRGMEDALARASETTHASEALAVHARRVEELVRTGGKGSYEDAAALIVRMGALRDAAAQAAYLADLRGRHGRKRNFMRLL